jgi:twitching motility protein PilT
VELNEILLEALTKGASDVHIKIGQPPIVRIDGQLRPMEGGRPFNYNEVNQMALGIMNEWQKERFLREKEVDMGYEIQGLGRFRVNIFQQRGKIRVALRIVPYQIKGVQELNLPGVIEKIAMENRGLILVTGTTGSGKSSRLPWRR